MTYSAEISRSQPALLGFLIDQSASMEDNMAGTSFPKCEMVAQYLDAFFQKLMLKNVEGNTVKNRFDIFALGYNGMDGVYSVLNGIDHEQFPVNLERLQGSSQLATRKKKSIKREPDGAGGIIETPVEEEIKVPQWINPVAKGGTPMNEAFIQAHHITSNWILQHAKSYPPIIINITDGMFNTEDPEPVSRQLRELVTDDGNVLFFNVHISEDGQITPVSFPDRNSFNPENELASKLFMMSSNLVESMIKYAQSKDKSVSPGAVGFSYNADFGSFIEFLDIGTRPAMSDS